MYIRPRQSGLKRLKIYRILKIFVILLRLQTCPFFEGLFNVISYLFIQKILESLQFAKFCRVTVY